MRKFDDFLNKQLQDKEFKKEYEDMQPEFDVIRAIIDARISQNLTQKELAKRTGINQADISKLEHGTRNPSINLLKRLAEGMDMALKIEFVPKRNIQKKDFLYNVCTQIEGGVIFFDPDSRKEVVGAGAMTYDEYLDVQFQSMGKMRSYFEMCYFNYAMEFKGQIERITKISMHC